MFHLGESSEERLIGVDPRLVAIVRRAIVFTSVDFTVFEGLRTVERQRKLVANGASRSMNSKHLSGLAVDLVPWVEGELSWRTPLCIQNAIAMREASLYFGCPITWGAVWDRRLGDLYPVSLAREAVAYVARYQRSHGPEEHPLHDPDHYQLAEAA